MPDLQRMATVALEHKLNFTGPLRHEMVVELAERFIPHVRYHELEQFHPVDLPQLLQIPHQVFAALPPDAREPFRISVTVDTLESGQKIVEQFDPPLISVPDGPNRVVLGSGETVADAVDDPALDRRGVYTHGGSFSRADKFFGSDATVAGAGDPSAGDPAAPRHVPVVYRAEMRLLLETLRHELQLDDLPDDVPMDAIRAGFDVETEFFLSGSNPPDFSRVEMRSVLRNLVAAHLDGSEEEERAALDAVPLGWKFDSEAWDVIKNFAFLEYYLVYGYNDYDRYGTWPFDNFHEGDVESFCIVLRRSQLVEFVQDSGTLVIAHSIVTTVHEEFQGKDRFKRLHPADQRVVWVAAGSHATYLTPGPHDILEPDDVVFGLPSQLPDWVKLILFTNPKFWAIAVLGALLEHFVDSEDLTSDDGVFTSPEPIPAGQPPGRQIAHRVEVTPLSDIMSDQNIYQLGSPPERARLERLGVRAFPGRWGADDGFRDHSSPWQNHTGRFFRRFMAAVRSGDVDSSGE